MKKILIILGHLLDEFDKPNIETKTRLKLGLTEAGNKHFDEIITSGWNYKQDDGPTLACVMKNYIVENSSHKYHNIVCENNSRDTVGDAYFNKARILKKYVNEKIYLTIVTSKYHAFRVKLIFDVIWGEAAKITVIYNEDEEISHDQKTKEMSSIDAFKKTFTMNQCSNMEYTHNRMRGHHPFYNGQIYKKIEDYHNFYEKL